jgi:5-methylthioadenosine/S-adenosylhomocysteine deaminase
LSISLYSDNVVLGGSSGPLRVEGALVRTEGARLASVEPLTRTDLSARAEAGDGADFIDLGDRLVAPAFVNAHTHLGLCVLRGVQHWLADQHNVVEQLYFKVERFLLPGDVRAFVRMGGYESLLCGVGTVFEHYYHGRQVAEALLDVGLTGLVAPTLQDLDGPGVPYLEPQLEATEEIAGNARLAEAGIVAALGPHATDTVSSALWARVREVAETADLLIHAHVAQSVEEYERSFERHGCSPIERLSREGTLDAGRGFLLVHGLFASDQDLARLNPARHALGFCPFSQLQFDFPNPVVGWLRRGLPVVVGTDAASCNDSMNVQKELKLMAGGSLFATPFGNEYLRFCRTGDVADARAVHQRRDDMIAAAGPLREAPFLLGTVWSAPGALEPRLPVGELRPGALANLAVWNIDHPACWPANDPLRTLAMTDATGALHGLMVAGRWTGTLGDFHRSVVQSPEYREAHREADERLAALLRRAGVG